MSRGFSREDLLFATLAVQRGVVGPADLAAAVARDPARPPASLADRLVAAGVLGMQDRLRVEERLRIQLAKGVDTTTLAGGPGPQVSGPDTPTVDLREHVVTEGREDRPPEPVGAPAGPSPALVSLSDQNRYCFQGPRAQGGQGRVLVAFDRNIGRDVAIKEFIGDESALSMEDSIPDVERFLREAQVTGQLEHPNIVPVHELARREDGTLYYAMRLVRGETMAERLTRCKAPAGRLRLLGAFWDLCNAIAFAHSRGVVHRDIKPANVMLNEFGQTVVLDWGVAKVKGKRDITEVRLHRPEESSAQTSIGTAIGTPAYMSPEQARGAIDEINERSDVWGLGAVLYEILTGRPPFLGSSAKDTMRRVRDERVRPVRQIAREAPPELATVAHKALQKDPELRYHSALQVAEEIDAYMTGGRVRAHEYSAWELLKRYAAQHKTAFAVSSLILAVIVGALVVVSIALKAETEARQREETERRMANYRLAQGYAEKADRLTDEFRFPAARAFAAASLLHNPAHPRSPFFDADFSSRVPASRELLVSAASTIYDARRHHSLELDRIVQTEDALFGLAYSPDGKYLAATGASKKIDVWETAGCRQLHALGGHSWATYRLAFSPDSRLLAATSADNSMSLWEVESGRRLLTYSSHDGLDVAVAFTPDSQRIVLGGSDGQVRMLDIETGRAIGDFGVHVPGISSLDVSADGAHLVTAAYDGTVKMWSLPNGALVRTFGRHADGANCVRISPDGRRVASASDDSTVRLWDRMSGEAIFVFSGHRQRVKVLDFSPDGKLLVSGGGDATVRLWDLHQGQPLLGIKGHRAVVIGAAFSPDGRHLATAGRGRDIKIWRTRPAEGCSILDAHDDYISTLRFSPDGRWMATVGHDRMARVWDAAHMPPRLRWELSGHQDEVLMAAFSPDTALLATASKDRTARVWNLATGRLERVLRGHSRYVTDAAFSPDGSNLATASSDTTIKIWNVATGEQLRTLRGHAMVPGKISYARDGTLYSASHDTTVRTWNPRTGESLRVLRGHDDWVTGLDLSPDGRWIASSGKDRQIILWRVADRVPVRRLRGHDRWVSSVVFSPDGRLLASACDEGVVRIWSVEDGSPLINIRAPTSVSAIDFTPDGRTIVVGSERRVDFFPLDFEILDQDPRRLLEASQRSMGWRLEGFTLTADPP